jgi:hypothetical protein
MTTGVTERLRTRPTYYSPANETNGNTTNTGAPAPVPPASDDNNSSSPRTTIEGARNGRARFNFETGAGFRAYDLQQRVPARDPTGPTDPADPVDPKPNEHSSLQDRDEGGHGTLEDVEGGQGTLEEREIEWGEVPQVDHTAREAPPVNSEEEEWNAVTGYIAGEAATNMNSDEVGRLRAFNDVWLGAGKPAAYAQWIERVGPGRPWDHKGAIQNAYGLSTPVPGKEGEISWDVWSNIHYGIVGAHAKFSGAELHGGADLADLATGRGTSPGDQLAVQIGIELYEKHGENVTPEQIRQAVIDNYERFGEAGKVYGDPAYLPEGWATPYSRE